LLAAETQAPSLVRFLLRSDSQSPSNCTLSRRVPGVFVQRKWPRSVGNGFASAAPASIDARPDGCFSGRILLVELRTDADFHVVATLEECHGSPLFVDHLEACLRKWLEDIGRDYRTAVVKAVSTQVIGRSPANVRGISHKRSAPVRDATPALRRCATQGAVRVRGAALINGACRSGGFA
jgi:hypothetical protein